MHFSSIEYALLLSTVFFCYWLLGQRERARLLLLLVASYTFYAWWNAYYLLLIVASTALDYVAGQRLFVATNPAARRGWLIVSLVGNLGLLGLFKYYNFFAINLGSAFALAGVTLQLPPLGMLLPVGISFYTFQSMSYTIDIYRGELEPAPTPLPFAVFVAFFPQLVAGPIVRAKELLPQLSLNPKLDPRQTTQAYYLIALGLLKKAVIADLLAVNLVDRVFETPALYTSVETLLGVYGYALQIYCDFSAYSDIAIGSALLLGLTLPANFETPYRATDLSAFWRRWHISLSSWLRDYLYIPLGGSRDGSAKTYRNLAVTMLLGGLWHGAAWTFVVWGAMHGVGLALTRLFTRGRSGRQLGLLRRGLGLLLTFHFVCLSWIFFRAPDFSQAGAILSQLASATGGTANISPLLWLLLLAGAATHVLPASLEQATLALLQRLPAPLLGVGLVAVVVIVKLAATSSVVPFIYFQF